jgi:hypothetical protein
LILQGMLAVATKSERLLPSNKSRLEPYKLLEGGSKWLQSPS